MRAADNGSIVSVAENSVDYIFTDPGFSSECPWRLLTAWCGTLGYQPTPK